MLIDNMICISKADGFNFSTEVYYREGRSLGLNDDDEVTDKESFAEVWGF